MDLNLKSKVALITASSTGLGFGIAQKLLEEGCLVAICSREQANLEKATDLLQEKYGKNIYSEVCDISNQIQLSKFVKNTVAHFGQLDIVIANTGGPPSKGYQDLDITIWKKNIDSILLSTIHLFQEALPHIKKSSQGRIVAVTSISAKQPVENMVISNSLRAAIHGVTKTLSIEAAKNSITVNAVCPSAIMTDRQLYLASKVAERENISVEESLEKKLKSVPLKRFGTVEEFSSTVAFLCSKQAGYITGVTLSVDGGSFSSLQ